MPSSRQDDANASTDRFVNMTRHPFDVLVIETDPVACSAIQRLLRQMGLKSSDCFTDPRKALLELKKKSYHIAVIDLNLPNKFGIGVIEQVKKASTCTQRIVVSSETNPQVIVAARRHGADDFVCKLDEDWESVFVSSVHNAVQRCTHWLGVIQDVRSGRYASTR